jgi:RNA polymerase sigma-70 factor (ECF subfamily)
MSKRQSSMLPDGGKRHFTTTRWSVVLAAAKIDRHEAKIALAQLCETYWYPLYAYVRRRVGKVDEARDLTQAFFCHLLERHAIVRADPERGRFRDFLLAAFKNFLSNEADKARAKKRGGGKRPLSLDFESGESRYQIEPFHELTPEKLYERRWVLTLLDHTLERLRLELAAADSAEHFEQFKGALTGEATADDYERAAEALGITPAAAKQAAYRMRKRYRQLFREEVAQTVADEAEVDVEIGRLLATLGGIPGCSASTLVACGYPAHGLGLWTSSRPHRNGICTRLVDRRFWNHVAQLLHDPAFDLGISSRSFPRPHDRSRICPWRRRASGCLRCGERS